MRDFPIIAIFISLLFAGCKEQNLPRLIDDFVDKTELNCDTYSAEDWEQSYSKFKSLTDEFAASDRQYSDAEQKLVARAIGRYDALLLKQEIIDGAAYIDELVKRLTDYINGLTNGLFDTYGNNSEYEEEGSKLRGSFEELGKAIDELLE